MTPHPDLKAPIDAWLHWVDTECPFAEREEKRLRLRQERDRPQAGSQQELADLVGVADPIDLSHPDAPRTRTVAAVLARVWFTERAKERSRAWHASSMNQQQAERDLADIDSAIDGMYEQGRMFG